MTTHELKTWPESYQAILDDIKRYEIRKDDRPFAIGDKLHLREWDPSRTCYTGRELTTEVTYLTREAFGIPAGIVVMGVRVMWRQPLRICRGPACTAMEDPRFGGFCDGCSP